jgi:2-polyprenyl-6-hydroxyphenyl methylase / 3-demethylubiquinone-9 3-methyltransferase
MMASGKNIPDVWDELWSRPISAQEDLFNLAQEENGIRWQRIERIALQKFGTLAGLRVIEIGAGAGTNALLMARRGAHVTILDSSESALGRAMQLFQRFNLTAEPVCQNALSLPADLLERYDIAMSFGLAEHFQGEKRLLVNKAHFDLLLPGGLAFISVPNKYNLPYRIFRFGAGLIGAWKVGYEHPYSRSELSEICRRIGITDFGFFGDSFYASFRLINPVRAARKILQTKPSWNVSGLKKQKGTPFDSRLAYALVLYGVK